MKRLKPLLILTFMSMTAFLTAQINLDVEGDATISGKLGIGTANPATLLNVVGSGNDVSLISDGYFMIGNNNNYNIAMDVNEIQARNNGAAASLILNDGGGNLYIGGNGTTKVGLGTTTPDHQLHLLGDGFIKLEQTGVANGEWGELNATADGNLRLWQHDANGAGGIDITSGGNVGIGTASPSSKLHVTGNGNTLRLEGSTSSYISFYPKGEANGRAGFFGFASPTNDYLYIENESPGGIIFKADDIDRMRIATNGNIGIGTTNPEYKLHIQGGTNVTDTGGGYLQLGTSTGANVGFDNNEIQARNNGGASLLYIQPDGTGDLSLCLGGGNVGIGTSSPQAKLEIQSPYDASASISNTTYGVKVDVEAGGGSGAGNCYGIYTAAERILGNLSEPTYSIYADAAPFGAGYYAGYFSGRVTVTGNLTSPSDRMLKKDIRIAQPASTLLMQLKPVEYSFDTQKYSYMGLPEGNQWGFIAQELEEILPELVVENIHPIESTDGTNAENLNYKSINYLGLVPMLTKAVQEQQELIQILQQQNEALRQDIEQIKQDIKK